MARAETVCRREGAEGDGVVVVGCWAIGGVELRPNMASMLGRNAAPRGVERKSAGRSDSFEYIFLAMGGLRATRKRNAPLIHEGMDPPVRKPIQSFVKELQLKSTGGRYHERAAATQLHANGHLPRI